MTLWAAIKQCAEEHPDGDPYPIALTFLRSLSEDDLAWLVAHAIAEARRELVRDVERSAFTLERDTDVPGFDQHVTQNQKDRPLVEPELPREAFALLLHRTFALGDRTAVAWGRATIPQHRLRIGMLMRYVDGTMATVRRHETAIEIIERAKVTCLAEVEEIAELVGD